LKKIFRLRNGTGIAGHRVGRGERNAEDIEYLRGITTKMKEGAQAHDLDQFYQSDLPSIANSGRCRQRVSGRMFWAHRGAALRLLFDEGPPPWQSYLFSAAQHEKIVEAPAPG